ncbi:MAG: NAD(P)/FAD-dependent oxidoreductase [Deltaproteobacteria bacterium]|nr:NAD(P)/FAD-dependent oxidoreductase [Deltaproteobacteria bacterium]
MEKSARPDRFRRLEKERFDVVVIGAGMGGLTAAALLGRHGKSVLVIDRHYVAGGNATVFKRPGYEFDVGLHYIGDCGPGGIIPAILHAAGTAEVRMAPLDPDGFDTLIFPDFRFRVPAGWEAYRARLLEYFPSDRRGIDRYMAVLRQVQLLERLVRKPWMFPWIVPRASLALRSVNCTLGEFLDTCTRNPQLRAVLAAENGDYGQPPSRVSLVLHAGLMNHFFRQGAFYPEGGGQILSDRLANAIESHGGKILLNTHAVQVLVRDGRAIGVELENKHVGRRIVHASTVVSNADIKQTLLELIEPSHVSHSTRKKTRAYEMSPGLGIVYLGLTRDLRAEGLPNTNFFVSPGYDYEAAYAATRAGRFCHDPAVFLTSSSIKDPHNPKYAPDGITNLQVMSLAPSAPAAWGVSEEDFASGSYRKKESYRRHKEEYAETLLVQAERAIGGLRSQVAFQEVATPLTHRRYTWSTGGTSYGIALTPEQFLHRRPGPRTEIQGLILCGASTRTGHGIVGSMLSGVMAARACKVPVHL